VVKRIEARTRNRFARLAARSLLNPARSFSNVMDWRVPWYRDSRTGILAYVAPTGETRNRAAPQDSKSVAQVAPFEFTALASTRQIGGEACVGGGGEAAYRVAPEWQVVLSVNGCKRIGEAENVSGDALVYQIGPRWTPSPAGKWSPFAHLLVGGLKLTQEVLDPVEKQRVLDANKTLNPMLFSTLHSKYVAQQEGSALAVSAGMGVDYKLNPALAIRVASVEYLHGTAGAMGGSGFQMITGMVVRWGTW